MTTTVAELWIIAPAEREEEILRMLPALDGWNRHDDGNSPSVSWATDTVTWESGDDSAQRAGCEHIATTIDASEHVLSRIANMHDVDCHLRMQMDVPAGVAMASNTVPVPLMRALLKIGAAIEFECAPDW